MATNLADVSAQNTDVVPFSSVVQPDDLAWRRCSSIITAVG